MSHTQMSNQKKQGFTLIELLVVIAIIAILASILFPVFGRARENARRSSCQSNLKQVALGIKQYTQDYDELFPLQYKTGGNTANPPYGWADAIQPYLKSRQIYQCPSEENPPSATGTTSVANYTDYYINAALGNTGTTAAPIYNQGGISEAAVVNSSLTILNADGDSGTNGTARYRSNGNGTGLNSGTNSEKTPSIDVGGGLVTTGSIYQRHLEGTTLSFADGHVKWYRTQNTGAGVAKGSFYADGTPFSVSQNSPTFAALSF